MPTLLLRRNAIAGGTQPRPGEDLASNCGFSRSRRGNSGRGSTRCHPGERNPAREAWLPILHTQRGRRRYTALSNTAQAHRAGKTHDWVVMYVDDGGGENRYTVITAERGPLRGRRIVAGREHECVRTASAASRQPVARSAHASEVS
jgi:hypothetical protein